MAKDRTLETATRLIKKFGTSAVFYLAEVSSYNPVTDTDSVVTTTETITISSPMSVTTEMDANMAEKNMFYCYMSGEFYDDLITTSTKMDVLSKTYTVYKVTKTYKNDTLVLVTLFLTE